MEHVPRRASKFTLQYRLDQPFREVFRWGGSVFPLVLKRPQLYILILFHVLLSLTHSSGVHIPEMSAGNFLTIFALYVLLLLGFLWICYQRYQQCCADVRGVCSAIDSITLAIKGKLVQWPLLQFSILRFCHAAHYLGYYGLPQYQDHLFSEWRWMHLMEIRLITEQEVKLLQSMSVMVPCYKQCLAKAMTCIARATREQKLNFAEQQTLDGYIDRIRSHFTNLYTVKEHPIPFVYFHLMDLLTLFVLLAYAYCEVFMMHSADYIDYIDYIITAFAVLAVRAVMDQLADPFGYGPCKLPVHDYTAELLKEHRTHLLKDDEGWLFDALPRGFSSRLTSLETDIDMGNQTHKLRLHALLTTSGAGARFTPKDAYLRSPPSIRLSNQPALTRAQSRLSELVNLAAKDRRREQKHHKARDAKQAPTSVAININITGDGQTGGRVVTAGSGEGEVVGSSHRAEGQPGISINTQFTAGTTGALPPSGISPLSTGSPRAASSSIMMAGQSTTIPEPGAGGAGGGVVVGGGAGGHGGGGASGGHGAGASGGHTAHGTTAGGRRHGVPVTTAGGVALGGGSGGRGVTFNENKSVLSLAVPGAEGEAIASLAHSTMLYAVEEDEESDHEYPPEEEVELELEPLDNRTERPPDRRERPREREHKKRGGSVQERDDDYYVI